MKKYLLDTHILLWWLTDSSKLGKSIRKILSDPNNYIAVSVASAWEINIKLGLNKEFNMSVSLEDCFNEKNGFNVLPVSLNHVFALEKLPALHKDPFDRMLISQAISEKCILISADKKIGQYSGVTVIG
ncbi:type II toxin-antitoxin system VapC family toxin [Patescibacteria group bacterium]|nr:type II toxin-antitoxin system VapC family toxin [Patescibacteria group bacterium]